MPLGRYDEVTRSSRAHRALPKRVLEKAATTLMGAI